MPKRTGTRAAALRVMHRNKHLFGRRHRGINPFARRSWYEMNRKHGGIALGTLAALIAPFFLLRRWRMRRQQNVQLGY